MCLFSAKSAVEQSDHLLLWGQHTEEREVSVGHGSEMRPAVAGSVQSRGCHPPWLSLFPLVESGPPARSGVLLLTSDGLVLAGLLFSDTRGD